MDFFAHIAEHTPQLNRNDNEILSYCIRNHALVSTLKVADLAERLFYLLAYLAYSTTLVSRST